jgi:hypothetical protein
MNSVRLTPPHALSGVAPCCLCALAEARWDQIVGKPYCPSCEELLVQGEASPVVERTEAGACAVCHHRGTLRFLTFPLESEISVEVDLCPEHLRALLGRRLEPHGYHQLRRQLLVLGIESADVFLLHEAFYDSQGQALQPAVDW